MIWKLQWFVVRFQSPIIFVFKSFFFQEGVDFDEFILKYNKLRKREKETDMNMIFSVVKKNQAGNSSKIQFGEWLRVVVLSTSPEGTGVDKINEGTEKAVDQLFFLAETKEDSLSYDQFKKAMDADEDFWKSYFSFRDIMTTIADI